MSSFAFSGLNLAITAPFDSNGRIDFDRFQELIERYLAAGVDGIVFSSGTGMHVYLSPDESRSLIERGARIVAGRAKVIAQASALLTADVVERTQFAKDSGADGVMILPPFFEGPSDDNSVFDFYAEVAKVGLPIIGYNVPQAVGVRITPNLLRRLCELPEFRAVKDSSGDLIGQVRLIGTGLDVINGADPLVPFSLFAGCSGLIWGGANIAPRTCVAIVKAAREKRWDDVQSLWRQLEPIMSLLWDGDYVPSVYAAAELTGYGGGNARKPFRPLSTDRIAALRTALGALVEQEAV
ncbi:MAG: dihydrodipicolinate synthase family protein [Mesorhizobium sp.]|uniref:dihydrodipicolinate synthase family protein n=1 Tax=Mesorhizobium sp. TaxID=1871066 RepID=UPI000FE66A2B|nr:dihydrodipicolinate synthase family protein [Mesorhizobium sp.]RWM49089.1 MAG: dihydrodipicolinate synthase family protein [Mesorhizobium sp.]RWM92311.1 MAG: dihydrodipicolinate synthase family protein [Mesorhizobium sp.]RWN64380.1 MAG: dihydrodipicolinate synthase family protein [Mesorhizobium sp.]TIL87297.1 MAG: dihydrodipicolinate synthase family protein [Mesorhizobium sp.]TIM88827.1 MAG: dihydrodipicolinate synthase family protein [Mesorhizobium sp.]